MNGEKSEVLISNDERIIRCGTSEIVFGEKTISADAALIKVTNQESDRYHQKA